MNGNFLGRWDNGGILAGPNFIEFREPDFSIPDVLSNIVLVTPTMGMRFNLDSTISTNYETIEIYDIFGKQVDTIDPETTTFWKATSHHEGLYFVVGTRFDGQKSTQKIVVKK